MEKDFEKRESPFVVNNARIYLRRHLTSSSSQRIGAVKQRALSPTRAGGSTRKEEKEETDAVVSTLLFPRDFFCGNFGTLPSRFYSGI